MAICSNCGEVYDKDNETQPCCSCCGFENSDSSDVINVENHERFLEQEELAEEELVSKTDALQNAELSFGLDHPRVVPFLITLAELYQDRKAYNEASPLYDRALAVHDQAFGYDHPDVIPLLKKASTLYVTRGESSKAESYFERVLAIIGSMPDPNPTELLNALVELADLYVSQEKYAQAEPLYKRALVILEESERSDSLKVSVLLSKLGVIFDSQGTYDQAELLYQRTVSLLEMDREKPHVIACYNRSVFNQKRSYAPVCKLYKRSLVIREQALSQDHPLVISSLHRLASLYFNLRYDTHAEALYMRLLAIVEKSLGSNHLDVATILVDLAELYFGQQADGAGQGFDHAQAGPLYKRALAIREKALSHGHIDLAANLYYFSEYYDYLGDAANSAPLYQRFLVIMHLDLKHPLVVSELSLFNHPFYSRSVSMFERALAIKLRSSRDVDGDFVPIGDCCWCKLAFMYDAQGLYERAESCYDREEMTIDSQPYFERSVAVRGKCLDPINPFVLLSQKRLASLYCHVGKYENAEPIYMHLLMISEKEHGPDHPSVVSILESLSTLYENQGNCAKAVPLYERLLVHREKSLNSNCRDIIRVRSKLAYEYFAQKEYSKAEVLFKTNLGIVEQILKTSQTPNCFPAEADRINVGEAFCPDSLAWHLFPLAKVYQAQGDYGKAETFYKRSLEVLGKPLDYWLGERVCSQGKELYDHVDILIDLGLLYELQGKYEKADPIFKLGVDLFWDAKICGPMEMDDVDHFPDFLAKCKRSLEIRQKALGAEHPCVSSCRANLGRCCLIRDHDVRATATRARVWHEGCSLGYL